MDTKTASNPGGEFLGPVLEWLGKGAEPVKVEPVAAMEPAIYTQSASDKPTSDQCDEVVTLWRATGKTIEELTAMLATRNVTKISELNAGQVDGLTRRLKSILSGQVDETPF